MTLLQYLSNETIPGYLDSGNIDWEVVWHYTIIVLVILAACIIAWVLVNLLFEPRFRERVARTIGLGGFRKK